MIAVQAHGASRWKTVVPVDDNCRLSSDDYVIAARLSLGVAPCGNMPSHCGYCLKRVGSEGIDSLHALSCVHLKGREVTHRHDAVQDAIAEYATLASCALSSGINSPFDMC